MLAAAFCFSGLRCRGRLERRGQDIVLFSASLAAAYARRLAEMDARIDARLKAPLAKRSNDRTGIEELPSAGKPVSAQVPAARTDGAPISPQASDKPASWWRQFAFPVH